MNQQNQNSTLASNPLEHIVAALQKKKKKSQAFQDKYSYKQLYQTVNAVVAGLDENIKNCKSYNEAKIYRKYQILLSDQNKRIRILQQKIKQQQKARSPSKKFIQDLLDKLINYKFKNQTLNKQNTQLAQQNVQLKNKLQIYQQHAPNNNDRKQQQKQQSQQDKSIHKQLQILGISIRNQVDSYLRLKNQLRKHQNAQKTRFQRFLKKIKDKLQTWTMRQFLQAVDRWSIQPIVDPIVLPQQLIKPQKKMNAYNQNTNQTALSRNQIRTRRTVSHWHYANNVNSLKRILK